METPALRVSNLTASYDDKPAIWGINFDLYASQLVAIVGPNGAGKSTLLKSILNLMPSSSGEVSYYGSSLDQKRSLVAYVPQKEEIDWSFPITVREVVMMSRTATLPFYKLPTSRDREVVNQAMKDLGILDMQDSQISNLSGGQQQRVFLARALAQEAMLYILDEPFAGIDVATERVLVELFQRLKSEGKTIICVHHDLSTVKKYFDYLLLINIKLIAAGEVEKVFNLENLQNTYGGKGGFLFEVAESISRGKQ